MMNCIACHSSVHTTPLFRTNPIGEAPGWMCQPCIVKHHDASLIDKETQEIVDIISGPAPKEEAKKGGSENE